MGMDGSAPTEPRPTGSKIVGLAFLLAGMIVTIAGLLDFVSGRELQRSGNIAGGRFLDHENGGAENNRSGRCIGWAGFSRPPSFVAARLWVLSSQ
jgi:hypothetical protein